MGSSSLMDDAMVAMDTFYGLMKDLNSENVVELVVSESIPRYALASKRFRRFSDKLKKEGQKLTKIKSSRRVSAALGATGSTKIILVEGKTHDIKYKDGSLIIELPEALKEEEHSARAVDHRTHKQPLASSELRGDDVDGSNEAPPSSSEGASGRSTLGISCLIAAAVLTVLLFVCFMCKDRNNPAKTPPRTMLRAPRPFANTSMYNAIDPRHRSGMVTDRMQTFMSTPTTAYGQVPYMTHPQREPVAYLSPSHAIPYAVPPEAASSPAYWTRERSDMPPPGSLHPQVIRSPYVTDSLAPGMAYM